MTTELDTEILFPSYLIPTLHGLRSQRWEELIDQVGSLDPTDPEVAAFTLMMVRLNGCVPCNPDSYKALRGCQECAQQTVRKFKGTDEQLWEKYQRSQREVASYLISLKPGEEFPPQKIG